MAETDKLASPRDARQSAKGALTRQRIIDAASDLMRTDLNAEVSIADIAKATGMSKGSVYHYFADSAEIVSQVLYSEMDRMLTAFEKVALSSVSAYEALVGITRSYVDALASNVALTRFVMGELHGARGFLTELKGGEDLVNRLYSLVSTLLERGKVEGTVRPDVDSTVASPAILGAFLGVSTLAGENRPADLNVERLVDALLSFIGFGVSARSKEELAAIA